MKARQNISIFLIYIWLAALTIKDYQEYSNIRIISTFIPFIILIINYKFLNCIRIKKPILIYSSAIFLMPLYEFFSDKNLNFYLIYLDVCVINAVIILSVLLYVFNKDFNFIAKLYSNAIILVCLLSYFTLEEQWFGGLSIRSLSDFPTFFALQVSVAAPFIHGKKKILKQAFILITLFFTFSRISLVLSSLAIIFQYYKEYRAKSIKYILVILTICATLILVTQIGQLMMEKIDNLIHFILNSDVSNDQINPSDLGRLAYASTTLNSFSNVFELLFGHGIKSNVLIIENNLDIVYWGLDESMRNATVHNLYLEILSDFGIIGLSVFSFLILYIFYHLWRNFGPTSDFFVSFIIFTITYIFEPNYVSFFFQFFIIFYLMASSVQNNFNVNTFKSKVMVL